MQMKLQNRSLNKGCDIDDVSFKKIAVQFL